MWTPSSSHPRGFSSAAVCSFFCSVLQKIDLAHNQSTSSPCSTSCCAHLTKNSTSLIPSFLLCCGPWGCKGSDMTEQLNWTDQQNMWLEMRKSSKNEGQFFTWSTGCHTLSQKEQTKAFLSWSWEDCGPNWRCPKGIWINLLLRRKTWARTECENR